MRRSTSSLVRVRSRVALVASCCLSLTSLTPFPVCAGESLSDLAKVSARPEAGSRLPLDAVFIDQLGNFKNLGQALDRRPAVLMFVDYACTNMCSAIVALTSSALTRSGLVPGDDFGLLAIGLAPNLSFDAAREFKDGVIDPSSRLSVATQFLTGDASAIKNATGAVGYHYSADVENAQFAHAAALFVVSGDGKVTRTIAVAKLDGDVLRQALVEAHQGIGESTFRAINLLCYGYAPSHGAANSLVWLILKAACAATPFFVAAVIFRLAGRRRAGS